MTTLALVDPQSATEVIAAIFVSGFPESWMPTVTSIKRAAPEISIVIGSAEESSLGFFQTHIGADIETVRVPTAARLIETVRNRKRCHVLIVWAPALFPPEFLGPATRFADENLRCSSISFHSNIADYLSFPAENTVNLHQVANLDETSITSRLRLASDHVEPAPIPYPVGPAVLLTAQGLSLGVTMPDHGISVELGLAEFGSRLRSRGMLDVLEGTTFISRPVDLPGEVPIYPGLTPTHRAWLDQRFPGETRAPIHDDEASAGYKQVVNWARAVALGITVILDGTCLFQQEMGTQVSLVALIQALTENSDIKYVGVTLPGPIPRYAEAALNHSKVDARQVNGDDLAQDLKKFPTVDVFHRAFQVVTGVNSIEWREVARRTVVTILDLIAYQLPDYHRTPDEWFGYRRTIRESTAEVDGILAISSDTRDQIKMERLSVDADRLFVVPYGIAHLKGDEAAHVPDELSARGFLEQQFVLVLGANYSHKNRDLAIRVVEQLRNGGREISLVFAGALVPFGSSRSAEAMISTSDWLYVIPDVTAEERNWLLRHAELVLYPTGAEGFGLVPHEAAAFGTPTVLVRFGPFAERMETLPVSPMDWDVDRLAKACESILDDPALASAQVEAFTLGDDLYDWKASARATIEAYRSLLARPPRSSL